jgi:hypothetical protein
MEFIFSCFDPGFFSKDRREEYEKMSVPDNPLLLEYLRNLFERSSLLDEDDFGGFGFRERDKEKPRENGNREEKENS